MDFLALLVLQIDAIDPEIARPVKPLVSDRQSSSIIVTIWKNLIPWHQHVSAAWSNGVDNAPAGALDVRLISGLSVKHEYKNKDFEDVSPTHQQLLIQTIAIAGQLLLIIGKRSDGRRLLMEVLEIAIEWLPSTLECNPDQVLEIMMEVAQSAWLDHDAKYSHDLLNHLKTVREIISDSASGVPEDSQYLENTKMIEVFANWARPSELNKSYSELPKSLFSRMGGDANDFYRHSMGQAVTACHS